MLGGRHEFWTDPVVDRGLLFVVLVVAILGVTRLLRRTATAHLSDRSARSQARKAVNLAGPLNRERVLSAAEAP